jgi:hypothetical protein
MRIVKRDPLFIPATNIGRRCRIGCIATARRGLTNPMNLFRFAILAICI